MVISMSSALVVFGRIHVFGTLYGKRTRKHSKDQVTHHRCEIFRVENYVFGLELVVRLYSWRIRVLGLRTLACTIV